MQRRLCRLCAHARPHRPEDARPNHVREWRALGLAVPARVPACWSVRLLACTNVALSAAVPASPRPPTCLRFPPSPSLQLYPACRLALDVCQGLDWRIECLLAVEFCQVLAAPCCCAVLCYAALCGAFAAPLPSGSSSCFLFGGNYSLLLFTSQPEQHTPPGRRAADLQPAQQRGDCLYLHPDLPGHMHPA